MAIQRLPVRFAIDRAGLVGADGPTHAGAFDVAYLGCLPGFVLMAAADEAELKHMVATAAAIDDRPSALRYPRGDGVGVELPAEGVPLEIGKGRVVREGTTVALLSYGARLAECLKAADQLAGYGLSTTVADARFAKPLDTDLVARLARNHEVLITVEEGSIGGFGSQVLQLLATEGLLDRGLKVRPMVLPDRFIDHDKPERMYDAAGLNAPQIVATVLATLGREQAVRRATWAERALSRHRVLWGESPCTDVALIRDTAQGVPPMHPGLPGSTGRLLPLHDPGHRRRNRGGLGGLGGGGQLEQGRPRHGVDGGAVGGLEAVVEDGEVALEAGAHGAADNGGGHGVGEAGAAGETGQVLGEAGLEALGHGGLAGPEQAGPGLAVHRALPAGVAQRREQCP